MNEDLDGSIESKTLGRFEKVLRTYWDGVPTPLFVVDPSVNNSHLTFVLRLLGYSPDYHGETREVAFTPVSSSDFCALSSVAVNSTPSTRIGNHYSPYVGTFSFAGLKQKSEQIPAGKTDELNHNNARIPLECCEEYTAPDKFTSYREFLRMEKVVELYEPLVREHFPHSRSSLRRIIIAATSGLGLESKEWIVNEVAVLTDETTRWMSQSIYYYMCMNPLFRRVLEPLQARTEADRIPYRMLVLEAPDRAAARERSLKARQSLLESLRWGKNSTGLFTALKILWDSRFAPLAFFNLSLDEPLTNAEDFVAQVMGSMRAAFTRLRLEFYAQAEDFFFSYIADSKRVLFMNEEEVRASRFNTVFTAMRIFLQNNLRTSLLQGLSELVAFFDCDGLRGSQTSERIALKHPLLKVDLVVGENYLPRSPQFSRLSLGLLELFDEAIEYANQLPQLDSSILRTLALENRRLTVLDQGDVAQLKTSLVAILDEMTATVDIISSAYSSYSVLPVQELTTSFLASADAIECYAMELRESYSAVRCAAPDRVYCGCVVIDSTAIKEEYCANWQRTLSAFYSRLYAAVKQSVADAEERVISALAKVEKAPTTVKELEQFLADTADTAVLACSLRKKECAEVIQVFDCMERTQIPIDPELYEMALKLMHFPARLEKVVAKAGSAREDCRPLLLEKLKKLRKETRDNMQTLSTGITELYNMFNFDICDIAAQTCGELRELVEQINATVKSIFYQEKALNVKTVDAFEDLEPLLTAFETIEQYWSGVYRSTTLREYYNSPVRSIDANKMIESVREWRRQIHAATRQVRAYPALTRLGRQQELSLAKFEELEDLLRLVTTPGLKKSHWKEIVRHIASKLKDDSTLAVNMGLPLQKLIDAGIANYLPEIARVAAQARNDYDVENALETMKSVAKKTHFQVVNWQVGLLSRSRVSPDSFKTVLSMIEDFVTQCHIMRQKSGVSSLVVGVLTEWEAATEKTRDVLLVWLRVEDQWDLMFPLLQNLSAVKEKDVSTVWPAVEKKLSLAGDAFDCLYQMVRKPQFSLYTAVVQESISDYLLSAKNIMADVNRMLPDALEQKRVAYPRFHFLTDSQLVTFLSPNNVTSLERLLPFMFSNVCGVHVEDGAVVAFVTDNEACLVATHPVLITDAPVEVWMQEFEAALRDSLLSSIRQCLEARATTEVSVWVARFCAQVVEMALRIEHTRGIREALRLCGGDGLTAYRTQTKDLLDEFVRLSQIPGLPKARQTAIAAGVIYLKHAVSEVECAVANRVSTVSDLDTTAMLQTFLGEDTIHVRFLGITCTYGFEFTGNLVHSVMGTVVETALSVMTQIWLGRTAPVLSGQLQKESVLSLISAFLGRFVLTIQGNGNLSLSAALSLLRGCMQHGALLNVLACETLSHDVSALLRECSEKVGHTLLLEKPDPTATIPVGPGGSMVTVPLSTHYGLVFCTNDYGSLPRSLSFYFRPVYVPSLRTAEVVRAYVDAFGLAETTEEACREFATMYDHCGELDPSTFSHRNLCMVLTHACSLKEPGEPIERLCCAFGHVFYSSLHRDAELRALFEWHLRHSFQRLVPHTAGVLSWRASTILTSNPQDPPSRLDTLMESCRSVILVGPPFSGKSTLWRRRVGSSPYIAVCPSLTSAAEFYGTTDRPGLLTAIAKRQLLKGSERQFVIMTDAEISHCEWWLTWVNGTRVLSAESDYLVSRSIRLIVTTQSVAHVTPNVACDYVVFCLPQTSEWQHFLEYSLRSAPHADVAVKLISTLLPALYTALWTRTGAGSGGEPYQNFADPSFLATCQHCASLYSRWYTYTREQTIVESYFDDLLADPRLFAAQCAVFAVCWNIGLCLPPEEQMRLKAALREAEDAVTEAMADIDVLDRVLPQLGEQDPNVLHLLCTPRGWKTFEEASECGFGFQWSAYSQMSSLHSCISSPVFATPSRQPTLAALQCLVDCGQNVVLTGPQGCGKSTVLSLTGLRERWVTLPVSANHGFSAASVQRGMADRLLPRSSGAYGPQPGRRLVICIDDVHLSPLVGSATPAASQLIAYCSSHGAICDPEAGFVPVTDVGFLASMTQPSSSSRLTAPIRSCINVYLPLLTPSELSGGLWRLFDAACQKKRVAEMPRACNSFLVSAHAAFLRALRQTTGAKLDASATAVRTTTATALKGSDVLDQFAAAAEECLPRHFKDALVGADIIRHHLLTSAPDVTVAMNIATATTDMYTTLLRVHRPEATPQLVLDLTQCTTQSLGDVLRTTATIIKANLEAAAHDHSDELPTKEETNEVADWIAEFELPGNALCETRLDTMYTRTTPAPLAALSRAEITTSLLLFVRSTVVTTGNDGESRSNSRNNSVIHSATTRSGSVGANGRLGLSRRTSTVGRRGSVSRRGSFSRRTSSRSLRGSMQIDTGTITQSNSALLSPTVQTGWLTRLLLTLSRLLQRSESHVALVGADKFGYRRLLRVLCNHTRLPLALLHASPDYNSGSFLQDMRTIVTFACLNDTRTVVYVPESILHMAGAARLMDGIVAHGDISDLFNKEERLALHRRFSVNNTKSLRTLTLTEDAELRRRVRRGISFILQVDSMLTMAELTEGYPALQQASVVRTTSASLRRRCEEELVSGALYGDDVDPATVEGPLDAELRRYGGKLKLRGKTLVKLMCDVYHVVAQDYPVVLEQLTCFAQQVHRFRAFEQVNMQRVVFGTRAISTRGDTATVEMNVSVEQRKSAAKECTDTQNQVKKLKSRLSNEEEANQTFQRSAKEAELQLQQEEAQLKEKETAIHEAQKRADEAVGTAAARLRRVKGTQLRSMKSMRLPEKGILLIRSVYKVLGQELPKHNGLTDLWFTAANIMSESSFVSAVAALDPGRITDVGPLLGTLRELGEVRYDQVFPYGQLLADFVVAYIESARTRLIVNAPLLEDLQEERASFEEMRRDVEGLYTKARGVLETASETQESIKELEARVVTLTKLQASLDQRVKRLSRYVGAVDRLSGLLTKDESADKSTLAAAAEGDAIIIAAFSTLLAPHRQSLAALPRIQALLDQCGVPYSAVDKRPFASFLAAGNPAHMSTFLSLASLPRRQQFALAMLYHRASPSWMLLGGVCPTFERSLVEVLRLQCHGCAVLSAFEGYLPDRLCQAMRDGEGVLLRDVFTPTGLFLLHQLNPLWLKLRAWKEAQSRDRGHQQTNSAGSGQQSSKTVRMPFHIFGRDVEVHPNFYVLATSGAPVPVRDSDRRTLMPTPTKWLTVFNFYDPVPRNTRCEQLLFRMPAPKNVTDELQDIRTRLHREMAEYKAKYAEASEVVALPLEQIASNGDAAIDGLEATILDFEFHFNQIAQLQSQSHNLWKRQNDDWAAVAEPLGALTEVIGFFEQEKMGRLWSESVLDVFIRRMPQLSPDLVSRLSPQRFEDLSKEQQRFYALFNCLQKAIQCFACGWPRPLRGLYALVVLNTVVLASDDIQKQRGTGYSQSVELLTREQLKSLRAILTIDGTRSAGVLGSMGSASGDDTDGDLAERRTNAILRIYEKSHDDLLMRIARSEHSSGESLKDEMSLLVPPASFSPTGVPFSFQFTEDVSLCADLFRALLVLDIKAAEDIALTLCATFSHSVLDSRTLSSVESESASPTARSRGRRLRGKSVASTSDATHVLSKHRANSIAASSVAAESVTAGGVRGDILELAAQGEVKVHSHLELTTLCTRESIAMCIPTNHVDEVLKEIRLRATDAQLSHHWHTVTCTAEVETTSAAVMSYFQSREMTKKGHWAIVEVAPLEAVPGSTALREFIEALLHTLALFHSRAAHSALGGDVEPIIPVRLTVVCTHSMWALLSAVAATVADTTVSGLDERENLAAPCLIISRGFVTPRYHLLSLLEKEEVQRGCELNPVKKRRADPDDEGRSSLRKPLSTREVDAELLERSCVLLFKELALLHVGVAEHTRYLRSEWDAVGASFSQKLQPSLDVEGDDDNLVTFLRVVRGWARRVHGIDGDAWVPLEDHALLTPAIAPSSTGTSLNRRHLEAISAARGSGGSTMDPVPADSGSSRHAHRHALNLYRQRRLAWQLTTAEGREAQVTNVFSEAFVEEEKATRASRRPPSQGEMMKRYCIHAVYLLFQKIAYLFVTHLAERLSEHVSVLHVIRHRICGPSPEHTAVFVNVDRLLPSRSADLTAERLNIDTEPELLRLDADTSLAEMRADITRLHSQLLGLCQYPAAVAHYEARHKTLAQSLLFGLAKRDSRGLASTGSLVVSTPPSACLVLAAALSEEVTKEGELDDVEVVESALAALFALKDDVPAHATHTSMLANTTAPEDERLGWALEKSHLARLHAAVRRACGRAAFTDDAPATTGAQTKGAVPAEGEDGCAIDGSSPSVRDAPPLMSQESYARVATHMLNTCHALDGTADTVPSLWLPCLKNPSLAFYFAAHYSQRALGSREDGKAETHSAGDSDTDGTKVVLVITRRELLHAADVVLVGARLSPLLQAEVQRLTNWPSACFGSGFPGDTDAHAPMTPSPVVVAARVLRGNAAQPPTQTKEDVSNTGKRLLWCVTPPTQRATDVLGSGGGGGRLSMVSSLSVMRPHTARPAQETEPVFVTEVSLTSAPSVANLPAVPRAERSQIMTPAPLSVYTKTMTVAQPSDDRTGGGDTIQQQWHCASAEVYGLLEFVPDSAVSTETKDANRQDGLRPTAHFPPYAGSAHFVYIE